MNGAGALSVERVSHRFGDRLVIDEMSFEAAQGRVTVLVGPSGCGKSTLLRLVAGIERPTGGRILIDGSEMTAPAAFVPPERRRVGLMFQDYALFPHLSALDNVTFGLGGLPRAGRRGVAEAALERVGLERLAGARPGQLSGGEQQRLALARALAPAPRVLLMDEPFSNLDRGLREDVRAGTLAVLREAGVTTIVVTHDPEEALAIGDHLVLLERGRVIQAGPPASLYARPASLAAARALSEVNLVPARREGGVLRTPFGPVPTAGEVPGIVGFRPEHLDLGPVGTGLRGRVTARSFRGATTLVTVEVPEIDEALRVAVPTGRVPAADEAGVVAQVGAAMVFPDGSGPS